MPSPYQFYLDNVLGNWETNIALADLWLCVFDLKNVNALKGNFSSTINTFEQIRGSDWSITPQTVNELLREEYQSNTEHLAGCVFARNITIPGERVAISREGLGYGGYLAPLTSTNRQSWDNISVNFLETNSSFLDMIIRPWLILTSYYGLVARAQNSYKNVKCPFLDVYQLGKDPYNEISARKQIRYTNVVPTSLESVRVEKSSTNLLTLQVSFAFEGYSVSDNYGIAL